MAKSQRGFAVMDPAMQREIARAGGRAAHQSGHAHEFTPEEAAEAGRKGGRARHHKSTLHNQDKAAHRQIAMPPESGEMQAAAQHPQLAESNGEVIGFNRQAAERSPDQAPDMRAFEGDGLARESSQRGPASQSREGSRGTISSNLSNESSGQARLPGGQPWRSGQRERSDNENMEGSGRGADENQRIESTDDGANYGVSDDITTGDVELLGGQDESRTSAARRGSDSEIEDEN